MIIKSVLKEYEVSFLDEIAKLKNIFELDNSLIVVDKNVFELYEELFKTVSDKRLVVIEAIEQNKVIDTALEICERLTDIPAKRNANLISIGGGIIQDITGFVANITYRGINWIFVATTLLSACDSCIGGKTSLNYKKYKNLLGTFYPPSHIYIAPDLFKTLSDKDFKSGLGEVIKFNIMQGISGLELMERDSEKLLIRDSATVQRYVNTSLEFKKNYIEIDEFDRGERIKLNFAHTFGHAIEVISEYAIPHGTAVAIGMIMANFVSFQRGYISEAYIKRMEAVLLKVIDIDINNINKNHSEFFGAIRKDKKQTSNSLTAVLINEYSDKANLIVVDDMSEEEVINSIEHFVEIYK